MENKNKPNLLIIGVHKAGTTSVFEYLSAHPEVCGSRKKELHYYTPLRFGRDLTDFNDYLGKFSHCGKVKYNLEASPSYLYGKGIIGERIKNDLGNVKLILILRDPVSRFISYYRSLKGTLRLEKDADFDSFLERSLEMSAVEESEDIYVRGVREGYYSQYLKEWLKLYDRNELKITFFESLKNDPSSFMKDIVSWLDLETSFYEDLSIFTVANRTRMPSNLKVHKLIVLFNKYTEPFFRHQRKLKHYLREFYFKINRERAPEHISEKSQNRLKELYELEIKELKNILKNDKVTDLPEWLS
ncbi:MAG: sulfotransferase domain-containing protein [Acidobacteriota bacterium]